MLMTVWLPLRNSTTCDALFDSAAPPPETKKPQNACAFAATSDPLKSAAPQRTRRLFANRSPGIETSKNGTLILIHGALSRAPLTWQSPVNPSPPRVTRASYTCDRGTNCRYTIL